MTASYCRIEFTRHGVVVDTPMNKKMKDMKNDDISNEQWERMMKWSAEQDRKYKKFVKEEERKMDLYYESDTYNQAHQKLLDRLR